MNEHLIIYEQPINELMRVCLRLEHCFKQTLHYLPKTSAWDSRAALASINETLTIFERSDLKTKLGKELQRIRENLTQLQHQQEVDQAHLQNVLHQINQYLDKIQSNPGRFGQKLRESKFLEHIRVYFETQGGPYQFDTPAFHLWLEQPIEQRAAQLYKWFNEFELVVSIVDFLMRLVRDSTSLSLQMASSGFYELNLDPSQGCQLIRVRLPSKVKVYPEISVGRHHLCIRFLEPNLVTKAQQTPYDIDFFLACCSF